MALLLSNPFSVRHVQPGALPFFFEEGAAITLESLLSEWRKSSFPVQIVGPHGSGKSTLIVALTRLLQKEEKKTLVLTLHDRQRSLSRTMTESLNSFLSEPLSKGEKRFLFIDGYEQLSFWSRFRFRRLSRRSDLALLISSHRKEKGFTLLFQTKPDLVLLQKMVDYLLRDQSNAPKSFNLDSLFRGENGNIRNILFELYDRFEEERGPF